MINIAPDFSKASFEACRVSGTIQHGQGFFGSVLVQQQTRQAFAAIIFIDQAGLVLAIHENAIPLDETPIPGGQGVQFVLEVNGGIAALFGISVGSQMQHPGIDQSLALWACESQ